MKLYSAEEIRKWDQFTIREEPISGISLMERAAKAAADLIYLHHRFDSVAVFCGVGNNGGDGLVVARLLHQRRIKVKVFVVAFSPKRSDDFVANLKKLPKAIEVQTLKNEKFEKLQTELIVDAIFGSGLREPVRGWLAKLIEKINHTTIPVISIDIPSGLFIRENDYSGAIVRATRTITFQTPKFSFLFEEAFPFVGDWMCADIGLHPDFTSDGIAEYVTDTEIHLKVPGKFDHKGKRGFLTVVAGFGLMGGAALLSARAAFRTGCGYVSVLCDKMHHTALLSYCPEVLISGSSRSFDKKTRAIAVGPGLGIDKNARDIFRTALKSGLPLVIDADAINLLATDSTLLKRLPENSILTPHKAEVERLIGKFSQSEKRLRAQWKFSLKHKVYILQKGAYSKLTTPSGKIWINSTGNPAMATAGMGDVLTGMIGSLLAQGYTAEEAARTGMFLHGRAGDLTAADIGNRGVLSSDVVERIPAALSQF